MKDISVLLEKYNSPVPRYTSYPPANYFTDNYSAEDYVTSVIESNHCQPRNISFYIHIPFCKRLCFFCGCNALPLMKDSPIRDYIDAVKSEIKLVSQYIDKSRLLSQIHFGGGTPNAIDIGYLSEITELIFSEFKPIENAEIAIECNPAFLDKEYAQELNKAGFNRYSLGIQDFNHNILKSVNREIPEIPISEIMAFLRDGNNKAMINLDFIYGLPGQTVYSFLKVMEEAVSLKPERLVTFSYAHVPWVNKAQKALEKTGLPNPLEKIEMFFSSYKMLKSNGYNPIGLDHYVLVQDELFKAFTEHKLHRNFQGYCTRETTGQVYAFGVSSISQLEKHYAQNNKSIPDYIESIKNLKLPIVKGYNLNQNEIIVREVINELMCNKKIDFGKLSQRLNITVNEIKSNLILDNDVLDNFAKDGIIELIENQITMTEEGILFIRNVAASLDPLLKKQSNSFSKSV